MSWAWLAFYFLKKFNTSFIYPGCQIFYVKGVSHSEMFSVIGPIYDASVIYKKLAYALLLVVGGLVRFYGTLTR